MNAVMFCNVIYMYVLWMEPNEIELKMDEQSELIKNV